MEPEQANRVQAYRDLDAAGFDQVPTGSNWSAVENFERTVSYCSKNIAPERLVGFLQTVWRPTLEAFRAQHMEALRLVGQAREQLSER
jgi:hypothetical protein